MYSMEQKRAAIETYIRFDHSSADTIAELGYPSRTMLKDVVEGIREDGEGPGKGTAYPLHSATGRYIPPSRPTTPASGPRWSGGGSSR